MKTGNGKIANLPPGIRDELNFRISDGAIRLPFPKRNRGKSRSGFVITPVGGHPGALSASSCANPEARSSARHSAFYQPPSYRPNAQRSIMKQARHIRPASPEPAGELAAVQSAIH
jgi:hypothetical protein